MNKINEYLRNTTLNYTNKLHDIISVILDKYTEVFNTEMKFNSEAPAFVGELGEYTLILTRDLNGLFVKVNVVNSNNVTVADCGLNVEGKFSETFTRMPVELKKAISEWFDLISGIDVDNIVLSTDEESEQPEVITAVNDEVPANVK